MCGEWFNLFITSISDLSDYTKKGSELINDFFIDFIATVLFF
jgi:hypothetical protein